MVVEDEVKIYEVIKSYLEASGYKVCWAPDGKAAITLFEKINPDLVLLDLMLPDISGEEVCKRIRLNSKTPIIMLTAKSQEEDTLLGLDLGADDYITKPFSPKEMVGRVRAVLRRCEGDTLIKAEILSFGGGYLEYKLLLILAKNPNKVFTREELVVHAFGFDYEGNDRAVDTHIKNLRQKVEQDSKQPLFILTVHGVGYKFGGHS
jgi:DNA-binding response OmpR family regulator